jgi:DNA-binding Xre family transcriptional regulator
MASINTIICDYINKEWLQPWLKSGKSQRAFADYNNIEESIVRKIKGKEAYRIPVETLYKICQSRDVKLSDFFKEIEKFRRQ